MLTVKRVTSLQSLKKTILISETTIVILKMVLITFATSHLPCQLSLSFQNSGINLLLQFSFSSTTSAQMVLNSWYPLLLFLQSTSFSMTSDCFCKICAQTSQMLVWAFSALTSESLPLEMITDAQSRRKMTIWKIKGNMALMSFSYRYIHWLVVDLNHLLYHAQ